MRWLLSCAAFFSLVMLTLSIVLHQRGIYATDWLRISARNRSAVIACAGDSVGAAIFTDPTGWTTRDQKHVKYQRFEPMNLERKFAMTFHGFAYRNDSGAHLVLAPMWFFAAIGILPPALMFAGAGRKRA